MTHGKGGVAGMAMPEPGCPLKPGMSTIILSKFWEGDAKKRSIN
jgi:hypothetical protein